MTRMRRAVAALDRRYVISGYAGLLATVAVVLTGAAQGAGPWPRFLDLPWPVIAAAFFAAEATALHIEIRRESHTISLSGIALILGLLTLDPILLVAVRVGASALALVVVRRRRGLKLVWNLALYGAECGMAAVVAGWALRSGGPDSLVTWIVLLGAVLLAELLSLLAVPVVIMVAEGQLRLSLYAQIGRSQVIAIVSATFGTITAAAMVDLPWLAVLGLGPLFGVAAVLRVHGQLGKQHHDLQQLHGFTRAIMGSDPLDTGLEQLATILRSRVAAVAVHDDDHGFAVRCRNEHGTTDLSVAVPAPCVHPRKLVAVDDRSSASAATALLAGLDATRGLVIPIAGNRGRRTYVVVADRLGASADYDGEETELFASLAANYGARLSADHLLGELERQARLDAVTGLANRAGVETELARRLEGQPEKLIVVMVDLDRYDDVKESLGYDVADRLLEVFADRLTTVIRPGDHVGRLGGDDFAVLVDASDERSGRSSIESVVTSLVDRLDGPIELDDITLDLDVTVGVTCWPTDGARGPAELLRQADLAMNEAGRTHRRWTRYDPTIEHRSGARLVLLGELRDALDDHQLILHFQPQVSTADLRPVGAEALIRWDHPSRGLLSPGAFLPQAEQSALAPRIARHVISLAVEELARLDDAGHRLTMSINLAARDLLDRSVPSFVSAALTDVGVDPTRVCFEVTESSFIVDIDNAIANLQRIRDLGCRTSVDDFGTGFASLQYLQRLPVDEVKIDRSFVSQMTIDPNSAAIVRSTIHLVHELGREVVAEGIEDLDTLDALRDLGCDVVQGYLIGRPMAADAFRSWRPDLTAPGPRYS